MALEEIYFISEIVAALAVIGSLVYVGAQLRQNTATIRIAAGQVHVDAYAKLIGQLTDSEAMMKAWAESQADFDILDEAGKTICLAFVGVMYRNFEGAYIQHSQGVLDDRFWQGISRSMIDQYNHAAVRAFWPIRRHWYSDDFGVWIDENVVAPYGAKLQSKG
jgi:hypothetical protein